jgi:tetratricopeptide (TPR) repeat protein
LDLVAKLVQNLAEEKLVQLIIKSYQAMIQARESSIKKEPTSETKRYYQQQYDLLSEAIPLLSQGSTLDSCMPSNDDHIMIVLSSGKVHYMISDELPMYQTFYDHYTHDQKAARLYVALAMAKTSIAALDDCLDSSKETLDHYNRAIELDQTYAEAYHRRALYYKGNGQLEKAQMDYLKSAVITPPGAFEKCARYYNGAMLLAMISKQKGDTTMNDDSLIRFLQLYDVALKEEKMAEMMHADKKPSNIWDYKDAKQVCDAMYAQVYKATQVQPICAMCKKEQKDLRSKLQACSRCHRVMYCSKEHQTHHWQEHKKVCNK